MIYLFPQGFIKDLKEEQVKFAKYNLKYIGTYEFPDPKIGICQLVEGDRISHLVFYADQEYGYELHPDFLYKNESLSLENAKEIDEFNLHKNEKEFTEGEKDMRNAQTKFGDIVRETFLKLSDEEKEAGKTIEQKNTRYEKWFKPMVDEIMSELGNNNKELEKTIKSFDENHENHVNGNTWYTPDEAFNRDVQYKLLPELYEKVQDKIKKQYEEDKTPYVIMFSSESPKFPSENKVYTLKEFNELLTAADEEFHNRKKYAEKKYGSADNYWDLEREDKLPEEDKGIQFGYDKTNFKIFNIPNPKDINDTFSYEPSRYDIGDGNGSVFDYVRATCSHDEFIEALNETERMLYHLEITEYEKDLFDKITKEESEILENNLDLNMKDLDKAQEEYKELHKKWLIESTESDRVEKNLNTALDNIKNTYDSSVQNFFNKVEKKFPEIYDPDYIDESQWLIDYAKNEAKKMVVSSLYKVSRDAQKAMNAEDYKTYNSIDWAKQRRIWEKFPANVNMNNYINELYENNKTKEEKETIVKEEKIETVLTQEDLDLCKKVIPSSQYKFTVELTQGEEGDYFKKKLKDIADTCRKITTDDDLVNKDGTHDVGFRYFLGDTELYISQLYTDGVGFGYAILNGDLEMSEWGDISIDEIKGINYMEMDYHVPEGKTIEEMLHDNHPDYFEAVERKVENTEKENKTETTKENEPSKPYNFYVADTAYLDLGIGAEFDTIKNLNAEDAVKQFSKLIDRGCSPYIGLNIPGDKIFDNADMEGAGMLSIENEKVSFRIGDNFVKELKKEDEHSQNVIAAYKELYEMADKHLMKVERPDFVFEKEEELKHKEEIKPLDVYTYSPFGYEGSLVHVETELRRGIPAFDIVGLADAAVKETRERVRYAFSNSGLDFPSERVLQSLSPADLRKDAPLDLSMAVSILGQTKNYGIDKPVLALGELELSGNIRPVRGAVAAVNTARASGIYDIICDPETEKLIKNIEGINILSVKNLKEADEKLSQENSFIKTNPAQKTKNSEIEFNEQWMEDYKESLENLPVEGHFNTIRAIEIAVAGKHNIILSGAPGCGKTLLTQTLMPALTPKLTEEESREPQRIASLAGLDSPDRDYRIPRFRMPHQTATIEGICGGGPNCRPGEISLAHKGTLFLDEAAEFRSSCLQMLRVPLESKQITLARAGRSTSYPADFQLVMATNPCPCGNYGSKDKICLDSLRSIEQYWKKFSDPLLDRMEIKAFVEKDENDKRTISIDKMKEEIAKAFKIQRERGIYNSALTPEQIQKECKLNKECQAYFNKKIEKDDLTVREMNNLLKTSLTIANMDGRKNIQINDMKEAYEYTSKMFNKPHEFKYNFEHLVEDNEVHEPVSKYAVKYSQQNKTVSEETKKYLTKAFEQKLVSESIPKVYDDNISPKQLKSCMDEQKRIIEPILNGERTGMYTAFRDFKDRGVFDIQGTTLKMSKNGGLTPTGWKQLQAAMEIYRSKKFETFRYMLIDKKTGELKDQLAITSHMPNFCNVSTPNDETLKQVITRAEEKDYLIAVCHNHPSGNTTESSFDRELTDSLDRSLRRNDGVNRFLGHIILDHDTFNLALPREKEPGHCKWEKLETIQKNEVDRFNAEPKQEWANEYLGGTSALKQIALKVNDTDNWNDEFVPILFTNADRNITGVQYYSKNFFENDSDKIRKELQFSAMEAGAIGAFPVITDSFWKKLGNNTSDFETTMKTHVMNDAFSDVAFNNTTITEKYDIEPGRNFYSFYRDNSKRNIDVASTWTPDINPRLFPPEGMVSSSVKDYKTENKTKNSSSDEHIKNSFNTFSINFENIAHRKNPVVADYAKITSGLTDSQKKDVLSDMAQKADEMKSLNEKEKNNNRTNSEEKQSSYRR